VSFQQVQKYEAGQNRISASTLYRIAATLKTGLGYFFEGLPDPSGGDDAATDIVCGDRLFAMPGGREMAEAFVAIKPAIRGPLGSLACVMAEDERASVTGRSAGDPN
jgi:transcriptional regulator with XRE-family HTH domain